MQSFLMERLNGARNILEIGYAEELALEPLDSELIDLVERENPQAIEVNGFGALEVQYREGYTPQVDVKESWKQLPDHGICLPGGRAVAVKVTFGYYVSVGPKTNIAELKTGCADYEARKAFNEWTAPTLDVPDLSVEGTVVPDIREDEYGTHAITGKALVVYGTLIYDSWYSRFSWKWYNDRSEAESQRQTVLERAESMQAETRQKREEAEAREREETERRAAEEDRQRQIDAGEAIADFETWHRRGGMTNNGEGWVISPDGSYRPHENDDVRRYKSDGNYRWTFVGRDELALRWSCGYMGDVQGNSTVEVVKLPVDGLTRAQREAVQRVETEEIGCAAGSFGLDPEAVRKREKLIADVADAIPSCPICKAEMEWTSEDFNSLIGSNGRGQHCCSDGSISKHVDWSAGFDEQCDAREAQVIDKRFVGEDGVVEALAYDKYGRWDVALRYRKVREGERPVEEEVGSSEPITEITDDALSKLFGGNVKVSRNKKR